MFPELTRVFKQETGRDSFYYGNFDAKHTKWTTYGSRPRFGTTYFGLRNRIGILSEAYAYAPYKERILATRDFVKEALEFTARHKEEIVRLLDEARRSTTAAGRLAKEDDKVAIRSEAHDFPQMVTVLGYVEKKTDSGAIVSTGEPKDYRINLEHDFQPTISVSRPFAYIFPPKYVAAMETLQRHGLEVAELREDVELDESRGLSSGRLGELAPLATRFQNHHAGLGRCCSRSRSREEAERSRPGSIVVRDRRSRWGRSRSTC